MEYAMGKTSTEDEKDDIAVRSVLEMGYAKTTIASAVEHLRKQGMTICRQMQGCLFRTSNRTDKEGILG